MPTDPDWAFLKPSDFQFGVARSSGGNILVSLVPVGESEPRFSVPSDWILRHFPLGWQSYWHPVRLGIFVRCHTKDLLISDAIRSFSKAGFWFNPDVAPLEGLDVTILTDEPEIPTVWERLKGAPLV